MNNKGFTLIEVIFSIAFLSIVCVVMLSLLVTSHEVEQETDMMDIAMLHISIEFENIKALEKLEETELIKFYDNIWQESDKSRAVFTLTVSITENENYENGLFDIHAQVTKGLDSILEVNTKHYVERGD